MNTVVEWLDTNLMIDWNTVIVYTQFTHVFKNAKYKCMLIIKCFEFSIETKCNFTSKWGDVTKSLSFHCIQSRVGSVFGL